MTSKERVLIVFGGGIPDRVPVNCAANPGIDRRLKAHFGLTEGDHEGLRQRLGTGYPPALVAPMSSTPFTGAFRPPAPSRPERWPRLRRIAGGPWMS